MVERYRWKYNWYSIIITTSESSETVKFRAVTFLIQTRTQYTSYYVNRWFYTWTVTQDLKHLKKNALLTSTDVHKSSKLLIMLVTKLLQ